MSIATISKNVLGELSARLANHDLPVLFLKEGEEAAFNQILVNFDEEENDPPKYLVQIALLEELMSVDIPSEQDTITLKLHMESPVKANSEKELDNYKLLTLMNEMLPFGQLRLVSEEGEQRLIFDYHMMMDQKGTLTHGLSRILITDQYYLTRLVVAFEEFQNASQTAQDFFAELVQKTQ